MDYDGITQIAAEMSLTHDEALIDGVWPFLCAAEAYIAKLGLADLYAVDLLAIIDPNGEHEIFTSAIEINTHQGAHQTGHAVAFALATANEAARITAMLRTLNLG